MQHPDALRRATLARSPGAPWVTWYRIAPAGQNGAGPVARVELSNATLDNWVAKTAGYLSEECDVGPGSTVGLDLPLHWLLHVWAFGAWALGAAVACVGGPPDPERRNHPELAAIVTSPGRVGAGGPLPPAAYPPLVCGTDPMAFPLGDTTPPGCVDVLADVRGYPDFFPAPAVAPDAPVIAVGSEFLTCDQAAARFPLPAPHVVIEPPDTPERLLAALLAGPMHGSPAVLAEVTPASGDNLEACAAALIEIARQEGLATAPHEGTVPRARASHPREGSGPPQR